MTSTGITPAVGIWHLGFTGRWSLMIACPCGAQHQVADGGCGPAPCIRGGAILTAPKCSRNATWRTGELLRVSTRLNPVAGEKLAGVVDDMDRTAQGLLEASEVTERPNERQELREAARTIAGLMGRVQFLHELATLHPDEAEAVMAGDEEPVVPP